MSEIDHDRLDQILSWAPQVCEGDGVAEKFEGLRRLGAKLSRSQARRAAHLERHLDAGVLVCDCFWSFRTDLLGR